ncbi:MAG: hypothetical protein IJ124_01900 [Clostridia bacterium]|nr:hypothetical protein [Clostridia bacterium]
MKIALDLKSRRISVVLCLALLILLTAFFFRNVAFSDDLFGASDDGRLTMLITEHWYHVFRGESSAAELGFFYPAQNTLGYSDMLFGFGVLHSVFRFLGIDVFSAYKATLMCIHLLGTVASFILLYRCLKIDALWSLFAIMTFSFSNAYAIHIRHTQLVAVSYVPLLALFLTCFFRSITNKRRHFYAVASVVTLAVILYTAWYIFFFTMLFLVTFVVVFLILQLRRNRAYLVTILKTVKRMLPELICYAILTIALFVPFVLMELPLLRAGGGNSYSYVSGTLPEAIDFINVSRDNWLFGPLMSRMQLDERGYVFMPELQQGLSAVLLIMFCATWVLYRKRNSVRPEERAASVRVESIYSFAIALIVSALLVVRLSGNGASLWWFVYQIFPGAASLRAVARYLLFLSFPVAVITACMGNDLSEAYRQKKVAKYNVLMLALLAAAFVVNIHNGGAAAEWNRSDALSFIEAVPQPPEDCESFFLTNPLEGRDNVVCQMDAYQIADWYGIKTINGYSAFNPENWGGIWNIGDDTYRQSVSSWILRNRLENVYAYDETEQTWTAFSFADEVDPVFDASNDIIPDFTIGIWDFHPDRFSWTQRDVEMLLKDENITSDGLLLKVGTVRYDDYLRQQPDVDPMFSVYVNGELIEEIHATGEENEYLFDVQSAEDDIYDIEIKCNFYFNPRELGINSDPRDLSLQLFYLGAP